jgi:hypothetical protein
MVTLRADPSGQVEQGAWEVGSLRACGWCYLWVCSFGQVSQKPTYVVCVGCAAPGSPWVPSPKIQEVMPPSHRASHRTATDLPSSSNPRSTNLEWVCTGTRHTSLLCIPRAPPPPPPSSSSRSGEGQAGFEDSASPLRAVSGPG